MSNARTREVSNVFLRERADGYTQRLVTDLYYNEGGQNFITYKNEPRGYYVSVSVETTKSERGFNSRIFGMFDGLSIKALVEPAKRFGAARLAKVEAPAETVQRLTDRVMAQYEQNVAEEAQKAALKEGVPA